MVWSAKKVRWLLLGGVLLLATVLAGFLGLARYRAGKIWQRILARNGVNFDKETNGFTYSQSSKGRTVFTLHASKATPLGHNRWALHDAVLILYGREPGRDDRIYGKEFQYDQDAGIARAIGEVHMDLQAPEPGGKAPVAGTRTNLGFGTEDEAADDPGVIHVRTSGVVYMRKLGLAATGEQAEFRYGGIACTSHGAEFDSSKSLVRLLAEVHMTGTLHDAPFSLQASHAELNRSTNTADLAAPVFGSGEQSARAAHAVLHLRRNGDLEAGEASGAVEIHAGLRMATAPAAAVTFGTDNHPDHARLFSRVQLRDADRARPAQGTASTVDLFWTPEGLLRQVAAGGDVHFQQSSGGEGGEAVKRTGAAQTVVADFVRGTGLASRRGVLQRVHMNGAAQVQTQRQTMSPGEKAAEFQVSADDLLTTFQTGGDGRLAAQQLSGTGHTHLEQTTQSGARQQSTGDALLIAFAPKAEGQPAATQADVVSSAVQTGHVQVVSWPALRPGQKGQDGALTTGRAERAVYAAAGKTLTLDGGRATMEQSGGQLEAAEIVLQQQTGDADATGKVAATSLGQGGQAATHVLASRAHLQRGAGLTVFYGTPGDPAQMWQAGSQIRADQITLDGKTHGLSARPAEAGGFVHAVFAAETRDDAGSRVTPDRDAPGPAGTARQAGTQRPPLAFGAGAKVPEAGRNAVLVRAATLDFDDVHHQALFGGGVRVSGVMGETTAQRGVATLRATGRTSGSAGAGSGPDLGGNLDRMVLLGDVHLLQAGRSGIGEQLTYTAATGEFVLTGTPGHPPHVNAEQGALVTGATLLFRNADSTIVVAGTSSGPKAAAGTRVHTETDLKQQNP